MGEAGRDLRYRNSDAPGEILSLKWGDVDFQNRTAFLALTKNGSSREVPLSSKAIDVLQELPRAIRGGVFPLSAEALKNAFERTRKRADMGHFNFHDLRHEAISRLFERA